MQTCTRDLILVLSCIVSWMTPVFASAVEATADQPIKTKEKIAVTDCEISQPALDAINSASTEFVKQGSNAPQVKELIDEAKSAVWLPECDSVRAKMLADQAKELLGIDEKKSLTSNASNNDGPLFTKFDGAWDFGLNVEFIEQEDIRSASFLDSLLDDKYGLHVGKEFYRTEKWFLGGQVHIVRTNDSDIDDSDEIAFDSTSLFATARHETLPALQLKVGLSRAEYENLFDRGSETGLVYGIGLATGSGEVRIHWLDYEVYRIGDEKFETVSVNLLVVLCVVGIFFGTVCL